MGFYGNAKSTLKANLQIDRHYANRAEMDANCASDGVYAGRYVMVEYSLLKQEGFVILYQKVTNSGKTITYHDSISNFNKDVEFTALNEGVIYNVATNYNASKPDVLNYVLYIAEKGTLRQYDKVKDVDNVYFSNYFIDKKTYSDTGRGYDSTIWQKIYENGTPKYINIAELNSVVPTFGIKVDPPSQIPISPHFDKNITNVYYDLHVQPAWGFRIREADDETRSDASTQHYSYNQSTDKQSTTYTNVAADIFFNKKAFLAQVDTTRKAESGINKKVDGADAIEITTAQSSRVYNSSEEAGSTLTQKAADIQELAIRLPAIGNMMSEAWDIIHGPLRNNSATDSLQGRLDCFSTLGSNQIPVALENSALVGATLKESTWVDVTFGTANDGTKTITVSHKNASSATTTAGATDNYTADFGSQFSVPYIQYDSKGHIAGSGTRTVTLPSLTIGTTSTGSGKAAVLTTISYNDSTNTIATTKQNVGTLLLTGYSATGVAAGAPAASDTLNNALAKLYQSIEVEKGRINDLDYTDSDGASGANVVTKVTQADGKIAAIHADVGTLKLTGYTTEGFSAAAVAATDSLNAALAKLQLSANKANNAIAALDVSDSAVSGKIVTAVSQSNGKIGITRSNIGTIVLSGYTIGTNATTAALDSADSLNTALGKLERNLALEVTRTNTAITNAINALEFTDSDTNGKLVSAVNQANGKISVTHGNVGALTLTDYTKASGDSVAAIAATDSLNTALGKLERNIELAQSAANTANAALTNAALDSTVGAGQLISKVSQSNGKVSVTTRDFATATLTGLTPSLEGTVLSDSQTIAAALNALEGRIAAEETNRTAAQTITIVDDAGAEKMSGSVTEVLTQLLSRIEALEAHHPAE